MRIFFAIEATAAGTKGAPRNCQGFGAAEAAGWEGSLRLSTLPGQRATSVQREVTLTQLFCWMLVLVASVAALVCASVFWSAFHLTDRPPHNR
jgi:hypothetical protein